MSTTYLKRSPWTKNSVLSTESYTRSECNIDDLYLFVTSKNSTSITEIVLAAACRQPRKIISFVLIVFAMATVQLYYSIKCCPLAWHCVGVAILTCFKVRKMLGKVVQSWSNAAIPVKVVPFTLHHFGIRQHWALALRTHIPLHFFKHASWSNIFCKFIDFLGLIWTLLPRAKRCFCRQALKCPVSDLFLIFWIWTF